MGPFDPQTARAGDRVSASDLNAQNDQMKRLGRVSGAGCTVRHGPGGLAVSVDETGGGYGYLAAGATISGVSGVSSAGGTLGTGTVTLCSRMGAALTANGMTATVYNAGGAITAPAGGRLLKLGWTDGDWSVDVGKCGS